MTSVGCQPNDVSVGIGLKELRGEGLSDVEMFEILHRHCNLKLFSLKNEHDINWGGGG